MAGDLTHANCTLTEFNSTVGAINVEAVNALAELVLNTLVLPDINAVRVLRKRVSVDACMSFFFAPLFAHSLLGRRAPPCAFQTGGQQGISFALC